MVGQRPTFLSTLTIEQKVRLCAGGAVLMLGLVTAGLSMSEVLLPEGVAKIGLLLVVYVVGGEIVGLLLAQIFGVSSVSIIAAGIDYGLTQFAPLRWAAGITIISVIVYGLFFSPDSTPWFGK